MISTNDVKRYCREDITQIKNYDLAIADKENMWQCCCY